MTINPWLNCGSWPIANSDEFTAIVFPWTGIGTCKGNMDGTDEQYGRAWASFCLCPAMLAPDLTFTATTEDRS